MVILVAANAILLDSAIGFTQHFRNAYMFTSWSSIAWSFVFNAYCNGNHFDSLEACGDLMRFLNTFGSDEIAKR